MDTATGPDRFPDNDAHHRVCRPTSIGKGTGRQMTVSMTVVEHIRKLDAEGLSLREIARRLNVHRDTVAKYTGMDNFSPRPPKKPYDAGHRVLAGLSSVIEGWLADDQGRPRKQRHTARRVFDRLVDEHGYAGSYTSVQRFIKGWKARRRPRSDGYSELVWPPAQAQVDFGQAQVFIAGVATLVHMLVVTFPYSNMRFAQVFGGETAECVCQGLRTIFEHIGGVPALLVFDNATGIGRRFGSEIIESKLFAAFRAHYRTTARYCNEYSGNEKGNVENAVGYLRRNLMVPEPQAMSLPALNFDLLARCDGLASQSHWRKDQPVKALFAEEIGQLLALPGIGFDAVTYQTRRADKDGRIMAGGNLYLAGPKYHGRLLTIGLRHDVVDILDENANPVLTFPRVFGTRPDTVLAPGTLLPSLVAKPGSWSHSPIRAHVPDPITDWLDAADHRGRSRMFADLVDAADATDFDTAIDAASRVIAAGDDPAGGGVGMLARRIGQGIEPTTQVTDLSVYNRYTQGDDDCEASA